MSQRLLMAGDVDAIREFVFETSSLPQIRGGSDLLLECEEEIRTRFQREFNCEVVYCGGGSFLLEGPATRVQEIQSALERLYLDKTHVATVTIICEEPLPAASGPPIAGSGWAGRIARASAGVAADGEFGLRTAALGARMRAAKMSKATAPFYEAHPFGKRCERCGKRMATTEQKIGADTELLCPICALRADRGRKRGEGIRGRFNEEFWHAHGTDRPAQQPQDLRELVKSAKRKYLALLYADGNDIGALLQRLGSKEQYREASKALTEGTRAAVFGALEAVCGDALQASDFWPFDIVNIGGDDVTVLVQAGYAWEVAVEFLKRFEDEVNRRLREALNPWPAGLPDKITVSCGIAVAEANYPIRYLYDLVTDVLKRAKKAAKREKVAPRSAVTFLWLPSPIVADSVDSLMDPYTYTRPGNIRCELAARPYTLDQAKQMCKVVRTVAEWPRALRHRWAGALGRGVLASANAIKYDIARQREAQRKPIYETLLALGRLIAPHGDHEAISAPIWYQMGDESGAVWRTALLDALELAELHAMRPGVKEMEEQE
ncbi:MAG: hypothetical protein Kow00123_18420 [Anaerolineales bacterium]